jgi:hypothetical protein
VTALLVGSVVVLLGFASGLGISPASSTPPQAMPTVTTNGGSPSVATEAPVVTSVPVALAPPIAYVVEPAAPPTVPIEPVPTSSSSQSSPSTATSPSPSNAPSTPATPSCSPGLLTSLLNMLLPNPGATDGGGLLGLGALLNSLTSVTSGLSGLLALDPTQLLSRVTDALASPGLASSPTSSGDLAVIAGSCTSAVGDALSLIADGATTATAVAAVEPGRK